MNKLIISISLSISLLWIFGTVHSVEAGWCSPVDQSTPSMLLGQPCTSCLQPNGQHMCGVQYSCCSGTATNSGSSLYCDVSSDSTCHSVTPIPNQSCPSNLSVTCGNVGSNVIATFSWNESQNADRYILRVNRNDGENPEWVSSNDHWYYVDDTVGSCNGTNCTAQLNQSTPKKFAEGDYLGWSVQAYYGNANAGEPGCVIDGGPFSCTIPQGFLSATCNKNQFYDNLSYLFSIKNITNTSGAFNYATFYLSTFDNQSYAPALRAYLGSPTWTSGSWQGYSLGRSSTLSPTKVDQVDYTWSTATSGTIGSNNRTVDDLSRWMQANFPDLSLKVGANLKYNNVQNDQLNEIDLLVKPSACAEGAGWGVDNVSVCWNENIQGITTEVDQPISSVGSVTVVPIHRSKDVSILSSFLKFMRKLMEINAISNDF